jgi:hypothetical protein
MTTISVLTAVWGERYTQFIPKWWDGVVSLQRKPDEILIFTDTINKESMKLHIPIYLRKITNVEVIVNLEFNDVWDNAFRACSKEWLAVCCIDDVFLPEALNAIDEADEAGAELVADSNLFHPSGNIFRGYWDPEEIFNRLTMPGAAPMKREMYERIGGFDKDIYFSDWAFYMKAAKAKIKVYQTDIIRIIYDEGVNHQTQSGAMLDSITRMNAENQIRAYSMKLQNS